MVTGEERKRERVFLREKESMAKGRYKEPHAEGQRVIKTNIVCEISRWRISVSCGEIKGVSD